MTPEDLLIPRIKHIEPYPASRTYLKVGDILTYDTERKCYRGPNKIMMSKETETFTANFKPLEWHEERKLEDMPEYLKLEFDNKIHFVHKVVIWSGLYNGNGQHLYEYKNKSDFLTIGCVSDLLPATEQEYINQNKQP